MPGHDMIPTVCIAGRPNVGKSSLFNRLVGHRKAVVLGDSGTTRDRIEETVLMDGKKLKLVDTGGYILKDKDRLSPEIKYQITSAAQEASVILFVTDVSAGITAADREVALMLRKFDKPVILVVNKVDNNKKKDFALDFFQLGYGQSMLVSCAHNKGLGPLKQKLIEEIEKCRGKIIPDTEKEKQYIKVAIVGRPNVGKSSFVNRLTRRQRVIVSDIPGTTRDSVDTYLRFEENEYILIDTAGIRHKRKIREPVDVYSVMRSKDSIERSDVVLLLLDAAEGVTRDDISILNFVDEAGKACLVLINKWDLSKGVNDISKEDYEKHLLYASNRLENFPMHFVSALTGEKVINTLNKVKELNDKLDLKVSTPRLNKIFEKYDPALIPIPRKKKRPNFLYITQSSRRPLEFSYFVNDPYLVLPVHKSFIINQLREKLPLKGVSLKVIFKKSRKGKK
jgi:GTP-binding protein